MILRRLRLPSFAGLVDAELDLSPGLNVIQGPNESGKSTLFQALLHTLLTPTRLTKPRFQRTVEPFLPAGGGDTIETELEFTVGDSRYRLRKRWGASPQSDLELPDGSRLTGEEAVQERLRGLLPADEGTLRAVLLTRQAGLAATVEGLGEHPEVLHTLSDLLRRSVLESDGVSAGGFRELLGQRIDELLGHWDSARRQPEDGRDAANPWKKGVGALLETYYEVQSLEEAHRAALEAEQSFEERSRRLESCRRRLQELTQSLAAEADAAADAERRDGLEGRRDAAAAKLAALEGAYAEWTESRLVRDRAQEERGRLEEALHRLETEQGEVERRRRAAALRERFARAGELGERWRTAQAALQESPAISREQIAELRAAAAQVQRLEGALAGGALSLRLEARSDLDLSAARDLEEPERRRLDSGQGWELAALGRIRLEHRDWSLEVTSGDAAFSETAQRCQAARGRLQALLQAAGVPDPETAESAHAERERRSLEAEAARRAFEESLEGESWEGLEQTVRELPEEESGRELEAVVAELGETQAGLGRVQESHRRASQQIAALGSRHESQEALLRGIGEQSARLQELDRELSGLAELPGEAPDAASFLEQYRAQEREAQALREQRAGLESELQEGFRHLPEETAEELAGRLDEARRRFERLERQGAALLRVREATDSVLGGLDDSSIEEFRGRFGEYVRELSGARYRGAPPGALLPESLERSDGLTLRYALLSSGTRDLFSLALRLAMAEYLLGAEEGEPGTAGERRQPGFLVMDDPLVDMDPERQRLAAAALMRFARRRQLIVFTCHPSHAEVLTTAAGQSGPPTHRVELGRG